MKEIRKEFLLADTQKLLFFTLAVIAAVAGYLFKKIRTEAFAVIILVLAGAEIFTISKRAHDHIAVVNPDQLERRVEAIEDGVPSAPARSRGGSRCCCC